MGCDIHHNVFVRPAGSDSVVPVTSVLSRKDAKNVPELVGERDYDLFGLFGNFARSWYRELGCFEWDSDVPEKVKYSRAWKRANDERSFHTVRWCKVQKLVKDLKSYKECLLDPKKWMERFDDESDLILDAVERKISLKAYQKIHKNLVFSIDNLLGRIEKLYAYLKTFGIKRKDIYLLTYMDS